MEIAEFLYEPEDLTVPVGTTVTWINRDKAAHTATADDGSFDTAELAKGDTAEMRFEQPGAYPYYCRFHPFMKATIEVE